MSYSTMIAFLNYLFITDKLFNKCNLTLLNAREYGS